MATISLKIQPYGGLVTGTVVLANADPAQATIGIKRDTDGFVIVAAETALTQSTTDTSVYTFSSTLLSSLVNYTAYIRVELLDEITSAFVRYEYVTANIKGSLGTTSLRKLRRSLQKRLGGYVQRTTTTTGPGPNQITSSDLIDRSVNPNIYDGGWVYICDGNNAGKQARVMQEGFSPNAGQLTLARDLSPTTESGVEFEWTSRLPAIQDGKVVGVREILNQALETLWIIDRVDLPDANGLYTSMNTIDWLRRQSQIIQVEYSGAGENWPTPYGSTYNFRYDAESPSLIGPTGVNTESNPLSVVAYRPSNTWIKRGGAWQESEGLVDDTDECLGDPVLITEVALWWAYKALANHPYESGSAQAGWEIKAKEQAIIAANIKKVQSPKEEAGYGLQWGWEPWAKELVPIRRRI